MNIAMDSSVLDLYERMLDPNNRQSKKLPPGTRYSPIEQEAFDIIDALEYIHKSGSHFCLLPSNIEELKRIKRPITEGFLGKCYEDELDYQAIEIRKNELNNHHEDLEKECKLLAEAEESGVNIILTRNGNFISELAPKSSKVKIMKPTDYIKNN